MRHAFGAMKLALWPALAAAFLMTGCGREHPEPAAEAGPAVRTATFAVGAGGESGAIVLPARIEAREEVTITARIPARLTRTLVREGEPFAEGDVLAEFAAPETREALAAARARREAAQVHRDLAARQEARLDSLYAIRVVALHEREMAAAERQAAEAELAAAGSGLAELAAATAVTAPFAGVVVRRHVDPGASVGPGTPLLDIRSREAGLIVVPLPESAVPLLDQAQLSFQVGDGPFHPATLVRLDGMVDFTSRSRTARLRPSDSGLKLEPGAFARVRIKAPGISATADAAIRIPERALIRRGGLTGVFVVRDGKAVLRWIRPGARDGDEIEVLAGLESGETIALEPDLLADGRPVEAAP